LQGSLRAFGRLGGALLASIFPADCLLCARILPWRQEGGVCLPCWRVLPWAPGRRPASHPLDALLWAADYEGPAGRLVRALKFEDMDGLALPLGRETAARLAPLFALLRPELVVPVPLHWWRHSRRGYNQAGLLARAIARGTGLPLSTRALARRRAGRRQLGLSRQERLASLAGCYAARASRVRDRRILLVDDVVTTGATLEACARALLRAGAAGIIGCAFARTSRLS
jgi:ComF family protein